MKRPTEAYRSIRLFETGIGHVVVARFKMENSIAEVGVFLVDAWCLGVKRAMFTRGLASSFEEKILGDFSEENPIQPITPSCARKTVEEAAAYALNLGFAPHPEYKEACRVFGGISVDECSEKFVFGSEGKPFYVRGPNETEARARQILEHLRRRCGEGNYHFILRLGDGMNPSD